MSSASLFLVRSFADIIFCPPDIGLAELEVIEAKLCKCFDEVVTASNSMAAIYHTIVHRHAACELLIKELTASSNSNIVSNQIQLLQNHKAVIEQDMIRVEDAQGLIWKIIQKMHLIRK